MKGNLKQVVTVGIESYQSGKGDNDNKYPMATDTDRKMRSNALTRPSHIFFTAAIFLCTTVSDE